MNGYIENQSPRKALKAACSISAIALACSMSLPAAAQSAADPVQEASSDEPTAEAGNEIVVTAQFREQRLQDTPLAITAYTGASLDARSATDIVNAASTAPNVNLSRGQGGFGQFAGVFIRGVGQSDIHFAVEPGVGMYIDDIYYGVMSGAVFQLLDTERVEVARGPQGTLSGKNSIGGSIKLYSKRPSDETDGYVEVTTGGRDLIAGRAAANFTIVPDRLFARISTAGRRRDGYLTRLDYGCVTGSTTATQRTGPSCKLGTQGGEEVWSARGSLLWRPSDAIENLLVLDMVEDSSENPAQKLFFQGPSWAGAANYITGPESYTNYEDYVSRPVSIVPAPPYRMAPNSTLEGKGLSNTLSIEISPAVKLTSITGYRTSDTRLSAQIDQSPASIVDQSWRLDHEQFTQELRLSGSAGDLLDWTVGGYYYRATGVSEGRVTIPGGLAPGGGGVNLDTVFRDPVKSVSKSGFVHLVLHPTERLNITVGGRYTDDRKDFTFNRYDAYGRPHPTLGSLVNLTRTFEGDRFDYRVNADYAFSDDIMGYAQVSTGYKGGGINPRPFIASQALPFEPETLTTYEAGLKTSWLDRRLTLNAAAFYSQFKNLQGTLLRCDSISPFPGFPCAQTTNIGDADIKGAELELALRDVAGFSFDGSVGYLDFEYKSVVPTSRVTLGMQSVYTPEISAAAGVQYEFEAAGSGTLTPRLDLTHRSSVETEPVNSVLTRLPALTLANARLTWESADENWAVTLAVTNLFDKFYAESIAARPTVPYFAGAYKLGQPRQWQISLRRNF
jgi:iron complex outermembrane receptor protein